METERTFTPEELIRLFKRANKRFIEKNRILFETGVSERTLCGALMLELYDEIRRDTRFAGYYVDVEYNRNRRSNQRRWAKEICLDGEPVRINCDLILHSRGAIPECDNLLALEMKKSYRPKQEKHNDRNRLRVLTLPDDCSEAVDPPVDPNKYVCGYKLGVYYEISITGKSYIEYYINGKQKNLSRIVRT